MAQPRSVQAHDLEREKAAVGDEETLTGFGGLELADGERGTMQAGWARRTSRPILWRQGPGQWPEWCSFIDAIGGTVACHPPYHSPPGEHRLNVTAIGLDPVSGFSQETYRTVVTVLNTR